MAHKGKRNQPIRRMALEGPLGKKETRAQRQTRWQRWPEGGARGKKGAKGKTRAIIKQILDFRVNRAEASAMNLYRHKFQINAAHHRSYFWRVSENNEPRSWPDACIYRASRGTKTVLSAVSFNFGCITSTKSQGGRATPGLNVSWLREAVKDEARTGYKEDTADNNSHGKLVTRSRS